MSQRERTREALGLLNDFKGSQGSRVKHDIPCQYDELQFVAFAFVVTY